MKKKGLAILLILMTVFGLLAALAIRYDRNLERGVLKTATSPDGMVYNFYIPVQATIFRELPLIVAFHGGTMTLEDMMALTELNSLADQFGFYVVYPFQDEQHNPDHYWNWFLLENQALGDNEPARVMEILRTLPKPYRIDFDDTVALGFSAGAAMALTMQILYADVFSGVALASGLPFGCAVNVWEAAAAMEGFLPSDDLLATRALEALPIDKGKPIRAILVHGLADSRVNPAATEAILKQLQAVNDRLDDGAINGSFAASPAYDGTFTDELWRQNRRVYYQDANQKIVLEAKFLATMGHRYPHPTSSSPFAWNDTMDFSLSAIFFLLHTEA